MNLLDKLIIGGNIPQVNWDEVEKIPEFQKLKEGGYHSEWHQEGSSFVHTQMVVAECQKFLEQNPDEFDDYEKFLLVAASLFHDIGKGKVARLKEDGNWSAPYHALEGERLTRFLLWDEPFLVREHICSLVRNHMKPKYFRYKREEPGLIEKIVTLIARNTDCRLLYRINQFDVMGATSIEKENEILHCETLKEYAEQLGFWNRLLTTHIGNNQNEWQDADFKVVMLCGVSGGGKTHSYEMYHKPLGYELISRDVIREELGMTENGKKFKGNESQEAKVTHIEHKRIKELCEQKKNFVSDNLFIRKKYRDEFINMIKPYNPHITIEYCETRKQMHLDRREGQIHPNTILNMMKEMDFPHPAEADVVVYNYSLNNKITIK